MVHYIIPAIVFVVLIIIFKKEFIKMWNETLRPKGRYELKRCLAVQGFNFGILYVFMPYFKKDFSVIEAVVLTLFGFSAACIGIAVNEAIKVKNPPPNNEEIQG